MTEHFFNRNRQQPSCFLRTLRKSTLSPRIKNDTLPQQNNILEAMFSGGFKRFDRRIIERIAADDENLEKVRSTCLEIRVSSWG